MEAGVEIIFGRCAVRPGCWEAATGLWLVRLLLKPGLERGGGRTGAAGAGTSGPWGQRSAAENWASTQGPRCSKSYLFTCVAGLPAVLYFSVNFQNSCLFFFLMHGSGFLISSFFLFVYLFQVRGHCSTV